MLKHKMTSFIDMNRSFGET